MQEKQHVLTQAVQPANNSIRAELRCIRTLLCGATSDYRLLLVVWGGQDQTLAARLTASVLGSAKCSVFALLSVIRAKECLSYV